MEGQKIIINGIKINYIVIGEGAPFLILHGWGSNSERWKNAGEQLSQQGYKVIIPDLPGFGKSDGLSEPWDTNKYVDFIEQFIKQLNLGSFYLLGHSFGGALAAKIAIKNVQNIKKLFLVSAAIVRKKTAKKNFLAKVAKIAKLFYFFPHYDFFRKTVYKFIIRRTDYLSVGGIMKDTYLNIISEDLSLRLPFIKTPTVIIWGEKDGATPVEQGYFIKDQIRGSKLVVIPEFGHDLNIGQPEILSEKITENI